MRMDISACSSRGGRPDPRANNHNTHLTQRDEDGLEEDLGLEQALLQCLVEVHVEPLELGNVVTDTRQHHQVEEPAQT